MNRLPRDIYDQMPWAGPEDNPRPKPSYDEIPYLRAVPLSKRDPRLYEFYELEAYLGLFGETSPGVALDAGAGKGGLSYLLKFLGWRVIACDRDPDCFRATGVPCQQVDLNKTLPYEDSTFDLVVCKQVIEHVENPSQLIRELGRVLSPGGRLILSTPNVVSLRARWQFLLQGELFGFQDPFLLEHRSPVPWTLLRALLSDADFENISYTTDRLDMVDMDPTNGARMRFLSPVLGWLARDDTPPACKFGHFLITAATRVPRSYSESPKA